MFRHADVYVLCTSCGIVAIGSAVSFLTVYFEVQIPLVFRNVSGVNRVQVVLSGVNRVQVVRSGFSMRLLCFV